jgi:hypothetical protein
MKWTNFSRQKTFLTLCKIEKNIIFVDVSATKIAKK